mmetsp:Transcript_18043/g.20202  ORF Transcript_18043/g.20202 Transcript_18043/m.20202 type:complete len:250 (+) Transcript_18043:22-771(+)
MRFNKQFEFHKVPEWDDNYFRYQMYCEKIGAIAKKMQKHNLRRVVSGKFDFSETNEVLINEEMKKIEEPKGNTLDLTKHIFDESLNYSHSSSSNNFKDLEMPLLSLDTDIKEVLVDFVSECNEISDFYEQEKKKIIDSYEQFHSRFLKKINNFNTQLNLEEDLKEHSLDGLGYSSSWSRQFVEFYSRLSWLEGFAKINIVAMQKILLKFENILFGTKESTFHQKLNEFILKLKLHQDKECTEQRKTIRN